MGSGLINMAEAAAAKNVKPDHNISADSLVDIPKITDKNVKEIDFMPIQEPFSYVRILLKTDTQDYVYQILEPVLNKKEDDALNFILNTIDMTLTYDEPVGQDEESNVVEEKNNMLKDIIKQIVKDYHMDLPKKSLDKIVYYILRDFVGYGKIEAPFKDLNVEDISCDGPEIPVFLYHRDYGSIRSNIIYESDDELDSHVISLSQRSNQTISVANPILDGTLPDGSRINATFGRDITTRGSSYTIRKFKEDPLTVVDLINFGTLCPEMGAHLWLAVQYGESMIFAGGSASGKTSTMNAIAMFIPPSSKVISIEDTREVNIPHENWIAGLTRGGAESDEEGSIDMYQLLRAALRQRPEYVLVGEVRGKETMTMFQAMATGHTTYSTMHADSVQSIVYRLENPPIEIPRVLLNALNMVIIHKHMRIKGQRLRRITTITEIVGIEPSTLEIITNQVFSHTPAGDKFIYGGHSNLYEKVMDREDMTLDEVLAEVNRRSDVIRYLIQNDIRDYINVTNTVSEYYTDPEAIFKEMKKKIDYSKVKRIM